jgi:hypothetical protein
VAGEETSTEVVIKPADVTVEESSGWLGMVSNSSPHAPGEKSICEAIGGAASTKNDAIAFVQENVTSRSKNGVPGKKLASGASKGADGAKGDGFVVTAEAKAVPLLSPHKWDIHWSRWSTEWGRAQEGVPNMLFKVANKRKFGLVRPMRRTGPGIGQIEQPHAFVPKKFPVVSLV